MYKKEIIEEQIQENLKQKSRLEESLNQKGKNPLVFSKSILEEEKMITELNQKLRLLREEVLALIT